MRNIHAVHGIFGDAKLAAANKKTGLEKIPIRFWG
jgi:hypothetical protein